MAINTVIMTGRLTADPELKQTPNGVFVCSFSIAQNRGKDAPPAFFECVAWRHTAEFICRNFHKGDGIEIVGYLDSRTYKDKDGVKRKIVEVVCDDVSFPVGKANREAAPVSYTPPPADYEEVYPDEDLPF